jgi:Ethanolamine utilization protein EutJ (predicted chaperonin)
MFFIKSRLFEKVCSSGNASVFRSVGTRFERQLEHRLFVGRHSYFVFPLRISVTVSLIK